MIEWQWQRLADYRWELFACPYCEQPPGQWCRSASGRVASRIHDDRGRELIRVAHEIYGEGIKMGKYTSERRWRAS